MPVTHPYRLTITAIAATVAIALSGMAGVAPALADTSPPDASQPQTASADSLPTAQINGVVWDQEIIGNTVYVGGNFTKARPAGSPAGSNEVARTDLMAYNLQTGVMTSFAPVLNGEVRALDSSPDGSKLYAVGIFTSVNGVTKNRIVAFDTATGAIDPAFNASSNAGLYAVTANASTVFFSGNLTQANGVARPGHAAAALATTGATTAWAPVLAGGRAYGMEVSPDGSKVVFGGSFTTLNGSGNPGFGMGAVNTTTGASLPWAANSIIRNAGDSAAIYGLSSDSDSVYASAYNFGGTGNTEGTSRISWDGTLVWAADCRGDNYSSSSTNGVVYITGHSHQCQWVGGFPQNNPTWLNQRAIAYTKAPSGVVRADNLKGQPATKQLDWFPAINAGSFTGQNQGAWTVQSNAQYVLYAGEFTTVNGTGQQGLSRFAVPGIAPNARGPQLSGASWPFTTASYSPSTVTVSWPSNTDQDNELLTYRVYRDGAVVYTTTGLSRFWDQPSIDWVDTGLAAGSSHTYRVTATDPFGNSASTSTVSRAVAGSGTYSAYAQSVTDDSPAFYYRLGESSGTAVANLSGPVGNTTQTLGAINTVNATAGSGVTRNVAGAITGDPNTASQFNGTSNGRIVASQQVYSDDTMSVETWFKTTTASGKMVGFGDSGSVTGNSGTYD
ncbi:MAG: domain containing protein, partial [Microbacteriaceae bacterium]|nr:domain containing protein [Microbacteriaceae bacterium]